MTRGRPRKFNEEQVLTAAMTLFLEKGLSATSLDDLAAAMRMNRPSIYNAFGSKEQIYRKSLAHFCGQLDQGVVATLDSISDVRDGFKAFFRAALEVYCATKPSLGCLMVCTAPAESFEHPEVGKDLSELMRRLDEVFEARIEQAQNEKQVSSDVQAGFASKMLQGTLQTIALRARCGAAKKQLGELADYSVDVILGKHLNT